MLLVVTAGAGVFAAPCFQTLLDGHTGNHQCGDRVGGASVRPDTQAIFFLSVCMSLVLFGTTFVVSAKVSGGNKPAGSRGSNGGAVSLLRTPGVARAFATSATVLAVVDLTMVYLPALGAERGLSAATVGAMLTVRAVFSMISRILLRQVSRRIGRMRLLVVSLALSTVALAVAAIPMPA